MNDRRARISRPRHDFVIAQARLPFPVPRFKVGHLPLFSLQQERYVPCGLNHGVQVEGEAVRIAIRRERLMPKMVKLTEPAVACRDGTGTSVGLHIGILRRPNVWGSNRKPRTAGHVATSLPAS